MKRALIHLRDRFFGRGAYSITVPPMDGVLRPNEALEAAPVLVELSTPDHLHADGASLWLSSGASIYQIRQGESTRHASLAADITAFARAVDGRQCLATLEGSLQLPMTLRGFPEGGLRQCVTGFALDSAGGVFLTVGSAHHPADAWQKDLLEHRASGSVWFVSPTGAASMLVDGLSWPQSPLIEPDGSVLLSESSASRVLRIRASGKIETVLTNLPGYPAGLAQTKTGYALCLKAPRNQLLEFILREPEFCAQMMREVEPSLWIAPALMPAQSFREPLQGGAIKQLGIMKPWAPTRSYGLVVLLDRQFLPLRSYHSRANGTRHGTVSCTVLGGELAVASVGAACVVTLPLNAGEPS